MNKETRKMIVDALRELLNREPSEDEVQNAQTDVNIMHKVAMKKLGIVL